MAKRAPKRAQVEGLEPRRLLTVATTLLEDASPNPESFVSLNGVTYFTASYNDDRRDRLFRTDGTPAGTSLVKDLDVSPYGPRRAVAYDGALYFSAYDVDRGFELWRSDGTPNGTVPLGQLKPGRASLNPANLTATDAGLFFTTRAPALEISDYGDLWVTDGTAKGAKRLLAGATVRMDSLRSIGGRLYFTAIADDKRQLFTSDGTVAGTVGLGVAADEPQGAATLTALGDKVFFTSHGPEHLGELMVTDGTPAGTRSLGVEVVGTPVVLDGRLRFVTRTDVEFGMRLASVDADATEVATDVDLGSVQSIAGLRATAARVFINVVRPTGAELLATDGTPAGTFTLFDATSAAAGRSWGIGSSGTAGGTILVFPGADNFRLGLWASDGTPQGTRRLVDTGGDSIGGLGIVDGKLLFAVTTDSGGYPTRALWQSDGTAAGSHPVGTVMLKPGTGMAQVGTHGLLTGVYGATLIAAERAPMSLALKVSKTVTRVGQPITLTAKLTGKGFNQGVVTFYDGKTVIGTAPLRNSADFSRATLTVGNLPKGLHTLTARYAGDDDATPAASPPLRQFVDAPYAPTKVTLARPSVKAHAPFDLVATVASAAGAPRGVVSFFDGDALLGRASVSAGGKATFRVRGLVPHDHALSAAFAGHGPFGDSRSTALPLDLRHRTEVRARLRVSTTGVLSLYARVMDTSGRTPTPIAGAHVRFVDVGRAGLIATLTTDANGEASFEPRLGRGKHHIRVEFGDSIYVVGYDGDHAPSSVEFDLRFEP